MIRPWSGALRREGESPPGTRQRERRGRGAAGAEQSPEHPRWAQDHRGGSLRVWSPVSQEECGRR